MKAKPSERLKTVLKVARLREQAAAETLAQQQKALQAQQLQSQQLAQYQREYARQFAEQGKAQTNANRLINYQRFYQNLEQASDVQSQRRQAIEQQCDQARSEWQQQHARLQNLDKLVARKRHKEQRDLEKKRQSEQDDRFNGRLRPPTDSVGR